MITYVKNVMNNCPDALFLKNILKKYEIVEVKEAQFSLETTDLKQYFEKMPENGLSISISDAELIYNSREAGACLGSKIWIYYATINDFERSKFNKITDFITWRDQSCENLVLHELGDYLSKDKGHDDFKNNHTLKTTKDCVSIINFGILSTLAEKLDYAYSRKICPFCERKIIKGL